VRAEARGVCASVGLPSSGLVLDHFSEGVLELCGHPLLEQREQRL
jgi:hypothetical protein